MNVEWGLRNVKKKMQNQISKMINSKQIAGVLKKILNYREIGRFLKELKVARCRNRIVPKMNWKFQDR